MPDLRAAERNGGSAWDPAFDGPALPAFRLFRGRGIIQGVLLSRGPKASAD